MGWIRPQSIYHEEIRMNAIQHRRAVVWTAMAISFGLFVFFVSAQTAQAQWTTTSNGDATNNNSSGKVGVGTTAPMQKLSVVGGTLNVGAEGDYYGAWLAGGQSVDSYLGLGTWHSQAGYIKWFNTARRLAIYTTSNGEPLTLQENGGNVGIGTTNPVASLDVNATTAWSAGWANNLRLTASLYPALRFYSAGASKTSLIGNNNDGGLWFGVNGTGDAFGSYGMVIQPDGKVGIGTTSPDTSLNVKAALNTWRIGDVYTASNHYAGISDAAPDATSYFLLSRMGMGGLDRYVNAPTDGSLDLQIGGTSAISILSNRKVGIGEPNPTVALEVAGDIKATGVIHAKYQDVAEWVQSSEQLAAGTVVVLDTTKSNQVISSSQAYDTRVAGVISAQPGIALGEEGEGKVLVATTGRVRIKVDATKSQIRIGDLLVTSDVPGVAMKSEPIEMAGRKMHMPGTLIGKALEPLEKGKGDILVLLSLQ